MHGNTAVLLLVVSPQDPFSEGFLPVLIHPNLESSNINLYKFIFGRNYLLNFWGEILKDFFSLPSKGKFFFVFIKFLR